MIALLTRDLRLALRAGGGFGLGLAFFLIVVVLNHNIRNAPGIEGNLPQHFKIQPFNVNCNKVHFPGDA